MSAIPTWWVGHQPVTVEPAAYRVLRTLSTSAASWVEYDVTSADFADAADGQAQQPVPPLNVSDAIIRSIAILNNSATAGENVNISFFAASGTPVPGSSYNSAFVSGPSVELHCSVDMLQAKFWLKADAGSPSVQLEVWYDIPYWE